MSFIPEINNGDMRDPLMNGFSFNEASVPYYNAVIKQKFPRLDTNFNLEFKK